MWKSLQSSLFAQFRRPTSSALCYAEVWGFHSRITSNSFTATKTHRNFAANIAKIASFAEAPTENSESHECVSSKSYLGIGRAVVSRCSHAWEKKADAFAENSSLQDILKEYGHLSPETTRRFWRVPALKPEDFLEILVGFGPEVVDLRKVRFLWKLFRWADKQFREFNHLPRSFEIMATMLLRARMLEDVESLLLSDEARGVFVGDGWMFSEIIQGYAEDWRLENSVALYDKARERGLVLSASCYRALFDLLTKMDKAELALRVYVDMIDIGFGLCSEERFLEFVVRELSKKGKTIEAVKLLKKLKGLGVEASATSLTAVAEGYCRKKDYEDALRFLKDWSHNPEASVCNKMVSSLCRNLGSEEAWYFVQRLEAIGFELNAITFGVLISQSCREENLRNAFIYLSESYFRRVKLDSHAYNALISRLFLEGMFSSVKHILEEMTEKSLVLGMPTYKVLLAGYCRHRKFDEVKQVLAEIVNCGMTSLSPAEDALYKAFQVLRLDSLRVKVKRDNDLVPAKAEFFDSLGNGLYLDTNVEEFDKKLEEILEKGMTPDFDYLIFKECYEGDIKTAVRVKDEAAQWGESLSSSAYCKLIEGLCTSSSFTEYITGLLDENPESLDQVGPETLNMLLKYLSTNGLINYARRILDKLFNRKMTIESDSYTALLLCCSKEKSIDRIQEYLEMAQRCNWLLGSTEIKELVSSLFKFGLFKDALELFDDLIEKYRSPDLISDMCSAILKEFCSRGFSDIGYVMMQELSQRGHSADIPCYTCLVEGFIKERKLPKAVGIIDQLLNSNINPGTGIYQLAVPLLFKVNGSEKAMILKQKLLNKHSGYAFPAYTTLVNEMCLRGKMEEAASQLHEMMRNKVFPGDNILNALIQGYCHVKSLRKALEIFCFMLRNGIDLSIPAYRSLIRQFCARSQVLGALRLEGLMHVKNESQLVAAHNILIFYLFQSGNSFPVKALLKKILEKNQIPNPETYNILIYGFYKCGDVSRSVKLLNTMIAKDMKPSNRNLRKIICYLCYKGEINKALQLSKVMECSGWKLGSVILYVLIEGLLQRGGISAAECFLDRIKENDLIPDDANLDLLIKKLCVHGYIKKAVDLLNVMLKKGKIPSEISYSLVVTGLSLRKLFDQALDFHAEMRYQALEPTLDCCNTLVRGLCDNGRTNDARIFLQDMLQFDPVPTAEMYKYVIDKYHAQNDMNKASELLSEMQQLGHSPNFETYWSLISNLNCRDKGNDDGGKGFLSRLLSGGGLSAKNYEE